MVHTRKVPSKIQLAQVQECCDVLETLPVLEKNRISAKGETACHAGISLLGNMLSIYETSLMFRPRPVSVTEVALKTKKSVPGFLIVDFPIRTFMGSIPLSPGDLMFSSELMSVF